MCKHKLNNKNRLKQILKVKKKRKSLKGCLKAKAPKLDFSLLPSIKSIIIQ